MLTQHDLQHLIEANKALQSAWERLLRINQCGNSNQVNNATMEYLQTLQMVWSAAQRAVAGKGNKL